ncbi:hypothetical protein PV04_06069 [Phialophora macrospora]|uniref:Uncharacterized protein n=1 Tax=Phialophora macrospora TaxID=1851006 RepID=A0A0D2G3X4_9EURO|nr:hypothetical protein PV04_06069 [Phialophora macrospora]
MSRPEKSTLHPDERDTYLPIDSPPSYENIILPASNPWTDTPLASSQHLHHNVQSQSPPQRLSHPPPSIPSLNPLSALSRLSTIPFSKYRVRDAKLSDDQTALTTTSPDLTSSGSNTTPAAQVQRNVTGFIAEQASLPPKPIMIIRGTHLGSGTQHGTTIVDFELKFNLTSLLDLGETGATDANATAANSGSSSRSNTTTNPPWKLKIKRYQPGSTSGSPKQLSREERDMSPLELWAKKFCEDKAENRSFTLSRQCSSLPTAFLEGHARNLLASTKYRGNVSVTFPTHHSSVTILRKSTNWFTNMLRLYPTKKYEVVSVEWPLVGTSAAATPTDNASAGVGADTHPTLQRNGTNVSVVSEPDGEAASSASSTSSQNQNAPGSADAACDQTGLPALVAQAWWREWHFAVRNSVLSGRKGWVTVEDWIEAKMGVREKERPKEWGVDYE